MKYYGIFSANGYAVFDDYRRALKSKQYLKGIKLKKFDDFGEALEYAEDGFYDLNPYIQFAEKPKLNQIVFRSHLNRDNYV